MILKYISIALVVLLLLSNPVSAEDTETKEVVDSWGVVHEITFNQSSEVMSITISNPTDREQHVSFGVDMDHWYTKGKSFDLASGETTSFTYNLTEGVDVRRDNHSVGYYAWSEKVWFNYTRDINPRSTTDYPTVSISDVEIDSKTVRGENKSVINVSGVNPSGRYRVLEMRVHTLETTKRGLLSMDPHDSGYETLVLNETAGELVVGEVRLYDGDVSEEEDGFEQVEVYGRSTEDTEWYQEEYVAVGAPFDNDSYTYTNESVHREKIGAPETVYESPVIWILTAVVGLFVLRKLNRLRR